MKPTVIRGGGWVYGEVANLRSTIRNGTNPSTRGVVLGFRCFLTLRRIL